MTRVLYKYRSMATPDARKHTLDILDNLLLYCPAPACLNDPFECHARISFDAPIEIKNERAKNQLLVKYPGLSETEAARLAPETWRELERDEGKGFRRWLREDTGVICFSKQKDDILMWSHYAGGHNGICIELQLAHKSHVDFFANVHEVDYKDQPAIVHAYAPTDIEKVKAFVLTKARHWSYEQECRMVIPDAERIPRYENLPHGIISAIYLGCQISPENRADILHRLSSEPLLQDVAIYQSRCDSNTFGLIFVPIRISKAKPHTTVSRGGRIDMDGLIENTTNNWFRETVSRLNDYVHPGTPENDLLFGVIPVAYNYCETVFLLAGTGHKLPAMAILRVLAELTIRVMWCLCEDNSKKEAPCVRIMRWLKTTHEEEIKYRKKLLQSLDSEETVRMEDRMASLESEIKKNPHPPIGSLRRLLDELPSLVRSDFYPLLYVTFNRAIHPDLKLFAALIRQEGSERRFLPDIERPPAHLLRLYAMMDVYNLLGVVHLHYGWDYDQMKAEYLMVENEFAIR